MPPGRMTQDSGACVLVVRTAAATITSRGCLGVKLFSLAKVKTPRSSQQHDGRRGQRAHAEAIDGSSTQQVLAGEVAACNKKNLEVLVGGEEREQCRRGVRLGAVART